MQYRARVKKAKHTFSNPVLAKDAKTDGNNDKKEEMKENKGVYVTKHDIREDQINRNYQLYTSKVTRDYHYDIGTKEAGVQYNYRKDNVWCTCRAPGLRRHQEVRYFSGLPKQVYAYHGSKSYTDIGVGSVKALQKKKIKRIYLPETDDRGVGSSDLSSFITRRTRFYRTSYYDHKKTSSKCVGGLTEPNVEFLNEKLSPIVQTRSGTTSPGVPLSEELKKNAEIGSSTHEKQFVTTSTQIQDDVEKVDSKSGKVVEVTIEQVKEITQDSTKKSKEILTSIEGKRISKRAQEAERVFSSDSLVEHIHNLEHPSEDNKQSPLFIDPMENKLEREYRKMFCTKKDSKDQKYSEEKPENEMKSTSVLRRRFEALRRGLAKKEDSKKNAVLAARDSINVSSPSHRDVSIASDPPSLECRSYSNTKVYSPYPIVNPDNKSVSKYKKPSIGTKDWSRPNDVDSEYQSVKGMFKLWGKKFNLDDEESSPGPSVDISRKSKESKMPSIESEGKREGKRFFFFKKRSKDKTKQPYKQKKGVTAGRCEVGDGLMIKIGAANSPVQEKHEKKEKKIVEMVPEDYEEMLRNAWLQQFLAQTIESRHSVKIRWNNNAYATSSSTVFEIMENVYKDTGVIFRSKSEVTTGESSYYKSSTKQRVNFVQDIEAWMIPKFIPDRIRAMPFRIHNDEKSNRKENIEVTISDQKWIIDKSKAFAQKIEVILHSNNVEKPQKDPSSEYLRIDIPKGFFSNPSTDSTGQIQTSNEEVYKIVEYETPESNMMLKMNKNLDKGDHEPKDIKVTVSVKDSCDLESKIIETVIKRPPVHRDVVIQGSNVYIPKKCNVIGVGIITQKDISKIRKPILKIQDYSDEDSDPIIDQYPNKSKFAESYLHDYYRHWTPLGMNFSSWRVNDSHMKCCSETSHITVNQQGDGSKSCPNIFDDYQTSAIISSCGTSCCSQCAPWVEEKPPEPAMAKFFKRFMKDKEGKSSKADSDIQSDKRVQPKDSLEVFKRRKFVNECTNKSKWAVCSDDKPYSVPSLESTGAQSNQDTVGGCPKSPKRACYKPSLQKKKACNKHVSLPNCDSELPPDPDPYVEKCTPAGILSFKGTTKCDFCNKKGKCPKHATTVPEPTCEIPAPKMPCKEPVCPTMPIQVPQCPPSPLQSPSRCSSHSQSPTPPDCPSPPPCSSPPVCPSPPACLSPPPPGGTRPSEHLIAACVSSSQMSVPRSPKQNSCGPPPCKSDSPPCIPPMSGRKPPPRPCPASPPTCRNPPPKCKSSSPSSTCPNSPRKKKSKVKPACRPKASPPPPACARPLQSPKSVSPPSRCPPKPAATASPTCMPSPPPCKRPSPPSLSPQTSSPPCPLPKSPPTQCCPPRPDASSPCCRTLCKPKTNPCCPSPCPDTCSPKPVSPLSPPCPPRPPNTPYPPKISSPRSSPKSCPSPPGSPPHLPKMSPKSSPPHTPPNRYQRSPPRSPPKPKSPPCKSPPKSSPCPPPPCPPKSPPKSPTPPCPPKLSPLKSKPKCNTPPCKPEDPPKPPCKACKPCPSQEFPWPTKNQVSNQPSFESVCPPSSKGSKCKKNCSFMPNRPKQKKCPKRCNSPPKMSGLFLKMKPSKKTCSKECTAWNVPKCPDGRTARSDDNFYINIKQSPSTDEIREGMHIKVQDEDGKTLYERIDYQNQRPAILNDMYERNFQTVSTSIVQNMAIQQPESSPELEEAKSEVSVANLIEINFKLKVTQGDKTTEINIGNEGVVEKPKADTKNQIGQTSHEVFLLKDEAEQCTEELNESNDKNDINIKIVIKNYKPKKKNDDKRYSVDVEEFTQKISEKFHTVSTGYSEIENPNLQHVLVQSIEPGCENDEKDTVEKRNDSDRVENEKTDEINKVDDLEKSDNFNGDNVDKDNVVDKGDLKEESGVDMKQVYSVHRATINLASSTEMSKTQMTSNEAVSRDEFLERDPIDLMISSRSATDKSATERTESKAENVHSKMESDVDDIQKYYKNRYNTDKGGTDYSMTDIEDQLPVDINMTSDEPISEANNTDVIPTSLTKDEKKRLLKRLFEKACKTKKMRAKNRTKQLREMLKMILTSDSSEHDENVASNELIKEMTYASLKPNYFRDTDSMNNYYKSSVISSTKDVKQNMKYPTQIASEASVADSDVLSYTEQDKRCLCSTFAARLNMCEKDVNGVCCCRKQTAKNDEETCCDLRTEEDFFLLNYKTIEYTDVETQNSKFICNSTNISVHSKAIAGSIRNSVDLHTKVTEIADAKNEIKCMRVKRTFSPHQNHIKPCDIKKLNRDTVLGISDEDRMYLLDAKPTNISVAEEFRMFKSKRRDKSREKIRNREKKSKFDKPADVLQCYETKKAVLEIYTEKTVSNEEERLVAKLPKFVYDKESEIERNYGEFAENSFTASRRNVIMMSVNR